MKHKKFFSFLSLLLILFNSQIIRSESKWWKLYFTTPSKCDEQRNNPERGLVHILDNAKKSFYGAFYSISSPEIVAAIIRAHKNRIDVKIVTEKDNTSNPGISHLIKAGIPVVTDNKRGFMHNKFAIIDKKILWTGSYNLTSNGSCSNNNNAIKIYSPELAEIYLHEFNEMFKHNIFGNRREYTPFPELINKYYVKIGKTNINVYFSPEDNIERIIIKRLMKAKSSIHFMAFSFTSDKIGETMIRKFKKGIFVYGLFDKKGAKSRYSEYLKMKLEGLPVKKARNKFLMHHKVIIIDKSLVIMGSYNFSKNANKKNDENILLIHNKEIAYYFLREFRKLYLMGGEKHHTIP
jgi:phosphatidylserine/phosphatidylglycerophosphate/cardiolipin synthase-like enzyme